MTYRVHRFDLKITRDQHLLEAFLNSLEGEVVSVFPNVAWGPFWVHRVDFLLIVERIPDVAKAS